MFRKLFRFRLVGCAQLVEETQITLRVESRQHLDLEITKAKKVLSEFEERIYNKERIGRRLDQESRASKMEVDLTNAAISRNNARIEEQQDILESIETAIAKAESDRAAAVADSVSCLSRGKDRCPWPDVMVHIECLQIHLRG